MTLIPKIVSTGLAVAIVVAVPAAQATAEPWDEPQDTVAALFRPDDYAWRLFIALNWPADVPAKLPDKAKKFGADGPVVWETWRNSRRRSPNTVYKQDGSDPGPWIPAAPEAFVARNVRDFDPTPLKQRLLLAQRRILQGGGPGTSGTAAFDPAVRSHNEVRINISSYAFIRGEELYNIEGQVAQFTAGKLNLDFPPNSKLIKASWRPIQESDKPRYHWAEVTRNNAVEIWGLTALHITTKDLPNWLWATFEHIDNKPAGPSGDPEKPNEGWLNKSVDRFACLPPKPADCEEIPAGIGLEGTKWANYRLRGTQIDFVDTIGQPTILANSQLERGFQPRSSCITCHALSAVNELGNSAGLSDSVGAPDPDAFRNPVTHERIVMQRDFLWSLASARRKSP